MSFLQIDMPYPSVQRRDCAKAEENYLVPLAGLSPGYTYK